MLELVLWAPGTGSVRNDKKNIKTTTPEKMCHVIMGTPCRKLKTTKTTLISKENVGRKKSFYAVFALLVKKLLITALKYASTMGI